MSKQEQEWRESIYSIGREEYSYLKNINIEYRVFTSTEPNGHEHCELCWERIR